jgi:hypothetical protein
MARERFTTGLTRTSVPQPDSVVIAARNNHRVLIDLSHRQRHDCTCVASERFPAGLARAGVPHSDGVVVAARDNNRLSVGLRKGHHLDGSDMTG